MFEKGYLVIALGIGAFGCRPATATPVAGPGGQEAQLVQCGDSAECYEKADEVCPGSYEILESGNRNATFVTPSQTQTQLVPGPNGSTHMSTTTTPGYPFTSSWHEVLVRCNSGGSTANEVHTPVAAEPKPADEAPINAAGFTIGTTLEATQSLCTNSSFDWKAGKSSYTCSGTPVDTGLGAHARLSFCEDHLCRIDVLIPPKDSGPAVSQSIERAVTTLSKRYGPPTLHDVLYGQSCAAAALPGCLAAGKAHFYYEWRWGGRKAVILSLGRREAPPEGVVVDPATAATIRIRYDSGQKHSTKSPAAQAAQAPAPGGEIDGL
jgi:hypothetical protein